MDKMVQTNQMNANKIKQLAKKMGKPPATQIIDGIPHWKTGPVAGNEWLYGFNPEASDADMVELLEKISGLFRVEIRKIGDKYEVTAAGFYSREGHATLRAAVVSFACKCWGIEE